MNKSQKKLVAIISSVGAVLSLIVSTLLYISAVNTMRQISSLEAFTGNSGMFTDMGVSVDWVTPSILALLAAGLGYAAFWVLQDRR